jgi:hypothetical protein
MESRFGWDYRWPQILREPFLISTTSYVEHFARDAMEGGMARLSGWLLKAVHAFRRNTRAGSRKNIAAHYDLPDNLAVVAAGRRRFTLFPPEQIHNLYMGPLDPTPAGQSISLVDFSAPDFERYPRFRQALDAGECVDLAPGDALFIPSMWFHHVESLDAVNLLINAWWRDTPAYIDSPLSALRLALMTLNALPERDRQTWRHHFQHFIFGADETTWAHIPPHARGVLGTLDEDTVRQARTQLLTQLKR